MPGCSAAGRWAGELVPQRFLEDRRASTLGAARGRQRRTPSALFSTAEACATIEYMLIPRYTVRRLLAITTVCAVLALIFQQAIRGAAWAQAVWSAQLVVVIAAVISAGLFFVAWVMSFVFSQLDNAAAPLPQQTRRIQGPSSGERRNEG